MTDRDKATFLCMGIFLVWSAMAVLPSFMVPRTAKMLMKVLEQIALALVPELDRPERPQLKLVKSDRRTITN